MEVDFYVAVAEPLIDKKVQIIYDLSALAKVFFQERSYSSEIEKISIGFLLVTARPGYEDWYKQKRPRYVARKTTKSKLTGETLQVSKRFNYEIKCSDELIVKFISATDGEAKKIIAQEIIRSLEKLNKVPKKITDFDRERFRADMQKFFEQ